MTTFEFVGANDGASTSGLVLELARVLVQDNPTGLTLWFVFFDGEEAVGGTWTSADSLYGSREFVKREKSPGEPAQSRRHGPVGSGGREGPADFPGRDTPPRG